MQITASQYLNNLNTETHHTGVFHYTRPVRGKHDRYIEMYGLLSVKSSVEIPGANIAKFAWDGIVDGFEYSKAESTNDAFKNALTEATRRVKQFIANDKNISDNGIDINFSIFVSATSGIYVGCLGECDIYIYKGGKIVNIYEMLSQKGAKTAGLLLEENDILFASTPSFLTRYMNELVGLSSSDHVLEKIEDVVEYLQDGEGVLLFTKSEEEKEVVDHTVEDIEKEYSEQIVEDIVRKKKVSHIDTNRKVKIAPNIGKILGILKEKLLLMFKKLKPIGQILKRFFSNISFWFKSRFGYIFEELAKKRWFKKASAKISQSNLNIPRREGFKSFKVDGYRTKNKQLGRFKIVAIVTLSIALLVVGIKFTLNERDARAVSKQANEIFKSVESSLTSAEEKKTTDRTAAETLVFKASKELEVIPSGLREKDSEKLKELEGRVLGIKDDLYKRKGLTDSDQALETYVGTRIAFGEGSNPSDIAIYQDGKGNEYLLVSDIGLKAVFRISLYNKEIQRVPDTEQLLKSPSMIYIGKSGLYVMDSQVGMLKAEFDENGWFKSFTKLTALGIDNFDGADISEFAVLTDADNVYVLDRKEGVLLKSNNYGTGYGTPYTYIKEDALTTSNDIFADLSTYILTSGSEGLRRYIYSYVEAKLVLSALEIVGIDGDIKNLAYGYTRSDLNFDLYVFDSEDRRILRFEKPIESGSDRRHPNQAVLKNQYVYRGSREGVWNNVHDLVITRDQKSVYMLDSTTIWKISL